MAGAYSLYLIRHAVAAERGEAYPDDAARPLTRDGARRWQRAVEGLDELGVELDLVLTSPLVRARQTAEILSTGLKGRPPLGELPALAPDRPPRAVPGALARYSAQHAIALVGHEPGLGELCALLLGARRAVPFKKGAVCRIDVDGLPPQAPGVLCWFGTPQMLRRAGGG